MINIERVISKTPMVIADYFTEDGLLKQVGLVKEYWNRIVVKELTDNALDAIEPLQDKKVFMDVTSGSLGIYDNGTGIKKETVEDIYDFENYVSQNRNYITASRGKQGNGLKTIISICYIQGYRLLWHTAEGIILEANIDSEQLRYGRLEVSFVEIGVTDKRGIEIIGIGAVENFLYDYFIGYSKCNPDVSFYLNYFGEKIENLAKMEGIDKSKNISIAYYDYDSYQNFIIHTQDGNTTYKQFLDNVFGTRMKNKSNIKSKIKDIDFKSDEFIKDFLMLKEDQQTKKYTLLKKQLIGLENILTTTVEIVDNEAPKGMNDKVIPCIVEFSVKKDTFKNETAKKNSSIECYINNSITYRGAFSITFKSGWYKIGNKSKYGENLYDLLHDMSNFSFVFHIISPYLKYTDAGKTRIDVSSFWNEVLEKLNKTIAKENRKFSSKNKKVSDRGVMRSFVTDAFNMASDNGRYAITARQIWYKMREISGIEEKKNTYADFTQNILTEWIDENPEYEDKINFSDRGNFYVDGSQNGLGTANVRSFINSIGTAQNIFRCYGGISSNIHIEPDFDLRYKYDKVLYIEKTGFEAIFKAEKVEEKYNMIIVSGQGFSTRAAKTLLYQFQEMGMKLYCLHDLDISGMSLEYFADLTGISSKTCNRYNIILEKNHLLFVYRSNDKMKNFDGTMRQINNCYSRYCDKELCIAYATDYENRYGYEHKIVQTRKNKEEADKNRRLAAIYNRICEGHEYPIEVVREVQKYIRNKNQYLQKLIDEKKAQSYMAFSEKEWVARLESQLRDESVFLQAKLESDCEFESNIWGEPNPLDIFIEEAV